MGLVCSALSVGCSLPSAAATQELLPVAWQRFENKVFLSHFSARGSTSTSTATDSGWRVGFKRTLQVLCRLVQWCYRLQLIMALRSAASPMLFVQSSGNGKAGLVLQLLKTESFLEVEMLIISIVLSRGANSYCAPVSCFSLSWAPSLMLLTRRTSKCCRLGGFQWLKRRR